jgi:hypothetical protein
MTCEVIDEASIRRKGRDEVRERTGRNSPVSDHPHRDKEFAMLTIRSSTLLRQALVSDAATTAACGAFMLIGASLLSGTLGLPAALLAVAGAALLPCALVVGYLGVVPEASRTMILVVIGANLLWAADSALLLVSGYVEPTHAGTVFVIAQALVTLMYAGLQASGLRRSASVAA